MDVFKRSRKTSPNKPKNPNTDVVIEEMDKRVITALLGHEEMAKKEAWIDIQGREKHGRVRCAPKGVSPSQLQSIGLPQSLELSEIPTSLLEKISEVVRKEFDENYRARVRAEMTEDFEALLQEMPRIASLDTFSMPPGFFLFFLQILN
ncbi:hypothetical protein LIER_02061 [Lithospermum erythrorhizon]|uniref:Uncharacterized protein n=1 Tax=Lithospermum erythrorhizon TaxID=34254 RepID=A0AAV3NN64_LITER